MSDAPRPVAGTRRPNPIPIQDRLPRPWRANERTAHIAPNWEWMDKLMEELEQRYWDTEMSIQTLRHWYYDFNTIHPLRDGNGRTGGITVAAISYHLLGIYLTPGSGP